MPNSDAVAFVGDEPISRTLFEHYVTQKAGVPANQVDAQLKASLLRQLEQLKAAAIAGEAQTGADTQAAIELQRLELLAHAAANSAGVFAPPTDSDLRAAYDRFVSALPPKEFHAAHILVASEAGARALIDSLKAGGDFSKLARAESADDSRTNGGDLGWIAAGKLPSSLTDALQTLEPGRYTLSPVHTIYGWHVIKLLEVRSTAAPPFDQVKVQLAADLQQARYQQFLEMAAAKPKNLPGG